MPASAAQTASGRTLASQAVDQLLSTQTPEKK
jgi:conjugal transfer/entry exclusion protein